MNTGSSHANAEQIFLPVRFDRRLTDPRVDVQEADDRNRKNGKRSSGQNWQARVGTPEQRRDHDKV